MEALYVRLQMYMYVVGSSCHRHTSFFCRHKTNIDLCYCGVIHAFLSFLRLICVTTETMKILPFFWCHELST
jgi:hypothetical protein